MKSNDDQVREAQGKIANSNTSRRERDEAFETIGRIDREERGKR